MKHAISHQLNAIQFINMAKKVGYVHGPLLIHKAHSDAQVLRYQLYWSENGEAPLDTHLDPIAIFDIADSRDLIRPLVHHFDQDQLNQSVIPERAKYFLVIVTTRENQQRIFAVKRIVEQQHLLPPNATVLEKLFALSSARLGRLPADINQLLDYASCPKDFLPWLASSLSVDSWSEDDIKQRQLIQNSASVQRHKGTLYAIKKALEALHVQADIIEWWQPDYVARGFGEKNDYHRFHIELSIDVNASQVYDENLDRRIIRAVDWVKPLRSHYSLSTRLSAKSSLEIGSILQIGSYKHITMKADYKPSVEESAELRVGAIAQVGSYKHLAMKTDYKPSATLSVGAVVQVGSYKHLVMKTDYKPLVKLRVGAIAQVGSYKHLTMKIDSPAP